MPRIFSVKKRDPDPQTNTGIKKIATKIKTLSSKLRPRQKPEDMVNENIIRVRAIVKSFHFVCRKCYRDSCIEDDEKHIEDWLAGSKSIPPAQQISMLQCAKCDALTCAGCGSIPQIEADSHWTCHGIVNHCCEGARLFGIWLLLSHFDKEAAALTETSNKKKVSGGKKISLFKGAASTGVGYSTFHQFMPHHHQHALTAGLMDLAGDEDEEAEFLESLSLMSPKVPIGANDADKNPLDPLFTKTLQLLIGFINLSPDAQDHNIQTVDTATVQASESQPLEAQIPWETIALFATSSLMDWIIDLARNDSITDMVDRYQLYSAVFDFVNLAASPKCGLSSLILEDRQKATGLHKIDTKSLSQSETQPSSSSWVASSLNSYNQAKLFLNLAAKSQNALDQKVLSNDSVRLCQTFIQLYEKVKPKEELKHTPEEIDAWKNFCADNKLTFSHDILKNHRAFCTVDANMAATSSTPARGRMNTINKEIANLQTSLPDGIFLKVDESRTDVMKVLMVGVNDTPYAGGLFTFDLWLDSSYPISPPKMKFVLPDVDEDHVPINPNLHVGGNVCLSLLNTWQGNLEEMWQPNKSTILSVLVSIQAMILGVAIPYVNEPGLSAMGNVPAAGEYTETVQCKTVKYAMIPWLKSLEALSPSPDDVWHDVTRAYWKHKSEEVLRTVKDWAKTNENLANYVPDPSAHPMAAMHHTKKKAKGKKKVVNGENLVLMLETLISPETIGVDGETSDPTGKHSTSSDGETSNAKIKRQKLTHNQKNKPLADAAQRWYYTGAFKMLEVRTACEALNVKPANGIQKTIDRIEQYINDQGLTDSEAARQWGTMKDIETKDVEV